jgi:phosphatidate phosphatase APP1
VPIAFVSGSPINLYPRLQQFFALQKFPAAPLLLKNLGVAEDADALFDQRDYKLKRIAEAQRLWPGYRLILVGDSGEQDPEIYAEVQRRNPKAVAAILIHRVTDEAPAAPRFRGQIVFARYAEAARALVRLGILASGGTAGVR